MQVLQLVRESCANRATQPLAIMSRAMSPKSAKSHKKFYPYVRECIYSVSVLRNISSYQLVMLRQKRRRHVSCLWLCVKYLRKPPSLLQLPHELLSGRATIFISHKGLSPHHILLSIPLKCFASIWLGTLKAAA